MSHYLKFTDEAADQLFSIAQWYADTSHLDESVRNAVAEGLRKRGIDKVILGGMSANLCVESHLRELLEQGFEVAVVKDATAAAQTPDLDGYLAAVTNFRFLANTVWTTEEAKAAMTAAAGN